MRLSLAFFIPLLATSFALPARDPGSGLDVRDGADLVERWDHATVYERDSFNIDAEKREVSPSPNDRGQFLTSSGLRGP